MAGARTMSFRETLGVLFAFNGLMKGHVSLRRSQNLCTVYNEWRRHPEWPEPQSFGEFADRLRDAGAYVGSGHQRWLISIYETICTARWLARECDGGRDAT
jgi:hypothetical protein